MYHWIKNNALQLSLVALAVWDIRIEIRLLLDHFTFTSILFAITNHPLSFFVLFAAPVFFDNNQRDT